MKSIIICVLACALLLLPATSSEPLAAQHPEEANTHAAVLAEIYPDLYDLLIRVELATSVIGIAVNSSMTFSHHARRENNT